MPVHQPAHFPLFSSLLPFFSNPSFRHLFPTDGHMSEIYPAVNMKRIEHWQFPVLFSSLHESICLSTDYQGMADFDAGSDGDG